MTSSETKKQPATSTFRISSHLSLELTHVHDSHNNQDLGSSSLEYWGDGTLRSIGFFSFTRRLVLHHHNIKEKTKEDEEKSKNMHMSRDFRPEHNTDPLNKPVEVNQTDESLQVQRAERASQSQAPPTPVPPNVVTLTSDVQCRDLELTKSLSVLDDATASRFSDDMVGDKDGDDSGEEEEKSSKVEMLPTIEGATRLAVDMDGKSPLKTSNSSLERVDPPLSFQQATAQLRTTPPSVSTEGGFSPEVS